MNDVAVVMQECTGLWRRTLLIEADGSRDTGTDVVWLQGISAYVDSRGFAGVLTQRRTGRDDVFEWRRDIDLQPPGEFPDAGSMRWQGETLVEEGVHADYVEHWVRDAGTAGPSWALSLTSGAEPALLLCVGDRFGWAGGDSVLIGTVGDDRWNGLGIAMSGQCLRANGVRWDVQRIEGEVNL
ncbi:hypothetical protein AU196_14910 [Mycobacterium sp. IS-1742]|uniref:hypothetical protein n=1 Tax=Mycobacterium sp. IS-1742 TaxID=1772285 RepID=UPI00074054B5|nr:hypothetical protein [Mycobacterium sp. IS-1742]KUI24626.1 hypothetical protein AU196_14910 [Mycobacterium sp. IS-1742]